MVFIILLITILQGFYKEKRERERKSNIKKRSH